jgi:hypothetical protein
MISAEPNVAKENSEAGLFPVDAQNRWLWFLAIE